MGVQIEITDWGQTATAEPVKLVSLTSEAGFKVGLLSLGATIHSVVYPGGGEEKDRDVILGFDQVRCSTRRATPATWSAVSRVSYPPYPSYQGDLSSSGAAALTGATP